MRQLYSAALVFTIAAPVFAQEGNTSQPSPQPPAQVNPAQDTGKLGAAGGWVERIVGRGTDKNGFYPELGGLPPGSGLSAGPGYRHRLFEGRAMVDASAAVSWARSTVEQVTFEALRGDRLSVGAQVKHQDFTRVSFYGIGPESREAEASQFGLRNTDYLAFASIKPNRGVAVRGRVAYSPAVSVRRPRAAAYPAVQDRFTGADAPALAGEPAFLHGDVSLDVDTRNHRSRPTSGGNYRVIFSSFQDRDLGAYSFRQIEGDASHYIPLMHERSVIALRGRVTSSGTTSGNDVPFYLLPTLGGSGTLRGYDDYRFRDRNLLLLNAEYRWRMFGELDGAVFYDTGKVAPRFGDLDFQHLRKSYGFGFRFHANDTMALRLDVGRSNEGTRLLVTLSDVFRPGHGSIVIPYVP